MESQLLPGRQYRSFRATTEIDAGQAAAIALLKDHAACPAWLYRCEESRLIEVISPTRRIFYQVTDLPFPARSRDVIFHAEITYQQEGSVQIRMTSRPDAEPESKHVRIREAEGSYLLTPLADGRTRVTWEQYVDPAGALPAWLVNSMLTDLPFRSLLAMRDLVTKPPYRDAHFVYNDEGVPTDISP